MSVNRKKTILIVEDEASMLTTLMEKFRRKKIHALKAEDGQEGLAIALKEHPDLIIVDLVMPKMDGMSMTKKLREDSWGKDVDVIFLTNLNDPGQVVEAANVGVYDFLVKTDWKLDDVVTMVKDKLDKQPVEEEE